MEPTIGASSLKIRFENATKIVKDTLEVFTFAYGYAGELFVGSMLNEIGAFDLVATDDDVVQSSYTIQKKRFVSWSHIWTSLQEYSEVLQKSFTYYYICSSKLKYVDDRKLSTPVIRLKDDLCKFMNTHAGFLAYCDMEYSGLFLYTNGKQALLKEEFLTYYRKANADLWAIEKKYVNIVPKAIMTMFDDIRDIITVREVFGETLIIPFDQSTMPRVPNIAYSEFQKALKDFQTGDIHTISKALMTIYKQCIPLEVLSKAKWVYHVQGERTIEQTSLLSYIGTAYENVSSLRDFIAKSKLPRIRHDIIRTPIVKRAMDIVTDKYYLVNYTNISLGDYMGCALGNAIRLHMRNVNLLVLSDMLYLGYYAIVHKSSLPKASYIKELLDKADNDHKKTQEIFSTALDGKIFARLTRIFDIAYKRVGRFYNRMMILEESESSEFMKSHEIMDLIFGDVYDNDGLPTTCCVCLENSCERKDTWLQCPNGHKLHYECYCMTTKSKYQNCPLCRESLLV